MQLKNHYTLLRHGNSMANQQGLIVSDIRHGGSRYGLSPLGVIQIQQTLQQWTLPIPSQIFHSDFLRTTESAELAAHYFECPIQAVSALRERHFGEFELSSDSHYQEVWQHDALSDQHRYARVESLSMVCNRLTRFVQQVEQLFSKQHILLVGHGDPWQILLTCQQKRPLTQHREQAPLLTAEARALV